MNFLFKKRVILIIILYIDFKKKKKRRWRISSSYGLVVWIAVSGYFVDGGGYSLYGIVDLQYFLDKDIVLVTMNYRLEHSRYII